jgi:hypothetical protein
MADFLGESKLEKLTKNSLRSKRCSRVSDVLASFVDQSAGNARRLTPVVGFTGIAPHHDGGIASDAAILTLVFEM